MRPAREGEIPVRVKNSYNPKAPGTIITKTRDMTKVYCLLIVFFYESHVRTFIANNFVFCFFMTEYSNEHCSET